MATALWTVALGLGCVLLVFSTYAAFVGFTGVLSGARYTQCPDCHHHYLSSGSGPPGHRCPHGVGERAYQLVWRELHQPHVFRS